MAKLTIGARRALTALVVLVAAFVPLAATAGAQQTPMPVVGVQNAVDPSLGGPSGPCSDAIFGPSSGLIVLSRTGDTSTPLTVDVAFSGTAVLGADYSISSGAPGVTPTSVLLDVGYQAVEIAVTATPGSENKTIAFTIEPSADYVVGSGSPTTLTVRPESQPGCGPPTFTNAAANTIQAVQIGDGLAPLDAVPFPQAQVFYEQDSGDLPDGVTLDPNGSFSGTTTRVGTYTSVIGACTPAYVAPAPPSQRTGLCALTTLTVTVEPTSNELVRTGSSAVREALLGLTLVAIGGACLVSARRLQHRLR